MFMKTMKKNSCWIVSGALLLCLTSCGEKKSEEPRSETTKETGSAMKEEPRTKEVPVAGQMGAHGSMSGGGAMGAHGGMSGGGKSGGGAMGAHGGMSGGGMAGGGAVGAHGEMTPGDLAAPFKPKRKSTRTIEVSEEIKNKWKEVSIHVRDKKSGASEHYKVQINSDFTVPDTDLNIKVGEFLPHFTMPSGGKIISASSEPQNPALRVVINEKDEEKYRGWLFAKFPEMHAFEHEKYAVSLDDDFQPK